MLAGAALASLFGALLLAPGGIHPVAWNPGPAPEMTGVWQANNRLQFAVQEQSGLLGPGTVLPGRDGYRYSAIDGGRVVRWRKGGPVEDFVAVAWRPACRPAQDSAG